MTPDTDRYYLEHVTRLGEDEEVFATEDIRNDQGIKLIAKGVAINRRLLDHLLQHRLLSPIDTSIAIAGTVTLREIEASAEEAVSHSPALYLLLHQTGDMAVLLRHLRHLSLNAVLANKLTVMRHRLPEQFEHSLRVAVSCLWLGQICRLDDTSLYHLANIGLYHDLGVLHIDPALLDSAQPLDPAGWRQMYAHPLIGYLILQQQPEFHPVVSRPVLEHHERLDGSGYPRHLAGQEISVLGRIIAVAESVIGICQKDSCEHLATILKSNIDKLDPGIMDALGHALYEANLLNLGSRIAWENGVLPDRDMQHAQRVAQTIGDIFSQWQQLNFDRDCPYAERVESRLENIRLGLIKAGIQPENARNIMSQVTQDASTTLEIASLMRETLFQLRHLFNEAHLHMPNQPSACSPVNDWIAYAERKIHTVQDISC